MYPLDTLKTKLQARPLEPGTKSMSVLTGLRTYPLRDLYSGVGSAVVATVPAASLFFATYHTVQHALLPTGMNATSVPQSSSWSDALTKYPRLVLANVGASVIAELASDAILSPCELIKQRAQMYQSIGQSVGQVDGATLRSSSPLKRWMQSSSSLRAARELFLPGQVPRAPNHPPPPPIARTLWRGYVALASRNLPYVALQFPLYEEFRRRLSVWQGIKYQDHAKLSDPGDIVRAGLTSAAAAASAGGIAAGLSTPFDVSKTRIMLGTDQDGVWKTMVNIARNEGPAVLMRGSGLRASWAALGAGVYLSTYETGRQWLAARRTQTGGSGPQKYNA